MSFFIGFLHTGFTAHPYGAFYAIEQIDGFIHLLHIVKGMCGGMRLLLFQDAFVEVFKADVTVFFQYNTITVITNRMFVLLCGAMTLSVCRQV